LSGGLVEDLGVRVGDQRASSGSDGIGGVGRDLSLTEGWESASTDVASAGISSVSVSGTTWHDGGDDGGLSLWACPVETVVTSVLADSGELLGETVLKAGCSLGDYEEESKGKGRFHVV
jgi:hypothetical protein